MLYGRMIGMNLVSTGKSLDKMNEYTKRRRVKRSDPYQNQTQEQPAQENSYYVPGEMKYFLNAETISNVEEVIETLQDKKIEIVNSDMEDAKKRKSLIYLQSLQDRCNAKMEKRRFENALEKKIVQAEENGDEEAAKLLREKYVREKSLRKVTEYSNMQETFAQVRNAGMQKSIKSYTANQTYMDLFSYMNGTGNFVNFLSVG